MDDTQEPKCSLCKKTPKDVGKMVANADKSGFICEPCVYHSLSVYNRHRQEEMEQTSEPELKKPREICEFLDQYVVGQADAKRVLAVAVYNHYKRLLNQRACPTDEPKVEIDKSNVLLIGPSGCGKTLLAATLAKCVGVPFAIADATTLTEAGYVGEDVENVLVKLLHAADMNVAAAQCGIVYIDEFDKIRSSRSNSSMSTTRDVSGEGVQRGLLKIIEGTVANVPPNGGRKHPEQKYIAIDTKNILFICGGAFTGLADIIARRLHQKRIGFASVENGSTEEAESRLISQVNHDDLIQYGMITELMGRLPIISPLAPLTEDEMVQVLTEPKNALLRQYEALFEMDGQNLAYTEDAVRAIVRNARKFNTGARALRTICEDLMTDVMYEIPDAPKDGQYILTEKVVNGETPLVAA